MTAFLQPTLLDLPTPQGADSAAGAPARVEVTGGLTGAAHTAPVSPRPAVTLDELEAIWRDWRPWAVDDRDVVIHAIAVTAATCSGLVHATDVRRNLSRDVNPCVVGAVVTALVRQHVLEDTGWTRRLGEGTMRNRTKRLPVRRLVGALPAPTKRPERTEYVAPSLAHQQPDSDGIPCAAHPSTGFRHHDGPCQCFIGGPAPEYEQASAS